MKTNLEQILRDGANKEIIFVAVEDHHRQHVVEEGIHFFSDELSLRAFKLGKDNVIWLDKIADSNCDKCYGTGKTGRLIVNGGVSVHQIETILTNNLVKYPQNIPRLIATLMKLPDDLLEPLNMLIKIAVKNLTDTFDNVNEITSEYAQIIKEDFTIKKVLWCKCFEKNLQKELELVRRNIKFSIN